MNIAILGTDPDVLRLASVAIDEGHAIVWIGEVQPEDVDAIARLLPGLTDQAAEWEVVLDRGTADAVLVGRGNAPSELRAEQLKRLAAEAMPVLVVHPACDSVLPYYEIDMARREMGGVVRHYNPVAGHPILADLAAWVRDGHPAIGSIHQVTCERRVADSSRANVMCELARDVETLADVAGNIRRTSAIGPAIGQHSFASLQVQMTCDGPASARWSVGSPVRADFGLVMSLVGERGTVSLHVLENNTLLEPAEWELETVLADEEDRQTLEAYDSARVAIRQLEQAILETNAERRQGMCTWNAATRAMEVVDAVELSLEKGRTIDVHQQQLTEKLAFRGTMSAIGCGLLLVGFAVFVVVSLFGTAEGKDRPQLILSWPFFLLAVLALFLLLQFAPLLITRKKPGVEQGNEKNAK
ncbi:MAG: hypothetical protein L0228_16680 [Planctomycetes bacterium]|nr:hypothetical protein [Planctomycetota bacterium]